MTILICMLSIPSAEPLPATFSCFCPSAEALPATFPRFSPSAEALPATFSCFCPSAEALPATFSCFSPSAEALPATFSCFSPSAEPLPPTFSCFSPSAEPLPATLGHGATRGMGRGGAYVPVRVAPQGRIRRSSPAHNACVFLLWKRRCADVRAGTQAPPLRFRLGGLRVGRLVSFG